MESIYRSESGRLEVIEYYTKILNESPVTQEGIVVDTSLGKTFLLKCGNESNPPLILLHGTSSNSASWFGDIEQFSKKYHVFSIDIPGEPGFSSGSRPDLESGQYTQWLNEVIETFDLTGINLTGQSFGGWIALNYASHYPQKVDKLVLISPSGLVLQRISFLFKFIPLMLLGDYGHRKVNQMICHKEVLTEEAEEFGKLLQKHFNYRIGEIPVLSDEELANITAEVLYFGGDKDVLLDSRKSLERLKRIIPEAETHLLRDTGHLILHKTDEILDFLGK